MERLVLKNCKQLLTAGANYHLYCIDGGRKVYVFSLGTRIGLSVDYVGAYPVSGQFKMIENEDDGTISFTSYKSKRLVVSNVENRPLLLFELDAVDEDEDDNDKVIKASMKFELFTNNKKNGAATDFGFFLRSVETKCFVRIALDGFLVADAKTCEQSTEFGFEPSELLQTRIRQLFPDGWYRMRSVDKSGKLSKSHYDVKVIRSEDNKDKGVLLCEDNKGRNHLTDNWECTYDSFRDYKLGFYDSFDGNQSFFETVVDETMTTLECKEVDGGKIVGIGLLLHEEGSDGVDYVCEGFDLCRASRTNADKFFFHPIEKPEKMEDDDESPDEMEDNEEEE